LLVDTHVFLWAMMEPSRLSAHARAELQAPRHEVHLSAVSLWEISLKFTLGKLDLRGITPEMLPVEAVHAEFILIPLEPETAATCHQLPKHPHADPFDRMLAWQAIRGGFTLVSKDHHITTYANQGLKVLW
jgi:PIN domain nuclease of toxin-antitoxin system